MRSSPTRTVLLFGALLGACNGRLAVLDAPIDGAEGMHTANSGSAASSGGTESGPASTCDLSQWRPGSPSTPRPIDCGVCSCENGEVVCEERPCLKSRSIAACPEEDPYSFHTTLTSASRVVGQSLHVETMGPGGCGDDDYLVCYDVYSNYEELFIDDENVGPAAAVSVRTSPAQAACSKAMFQTFDVDLSPMESLLPPNRGALDTEHGYVVLGELTCADYRFMAHDEALRASTATHIESSESGCEMDSDCQNLQLATSCGGGCFNIDVTTELAPEVENDFRAIDETICQPYLDAQCGPPSSCDGQPARRPLCIDGHCEGRYVEDGSQ